MMKVLVFGLAIEMILGFADFLCFKICLGYREIFQAYIVLSRYLKGWHLL